jgi:hypothetical protein
MGNLALTPSETEGGSRGACLGESTEGLSVLYKLRSTLTPTLSLPGRGSCGSFGAGFGCREAVSERSKNSPTIGSGAPCVAIETGAPDG